MVSKFLMICFLYSSPLHIIKLGNMKINRSITEPIIKINTHWEERWNDIDRGLILAWEVGRQFSARDLELAAKASAGQLVGLPWKGGIDKELKKKKKYGTLLYLAAWQGLRGEDLDIDTDQEPELTCTATGMSVTYTADSKKYADPMYTEPLFIGVDCDESENSVKTSGTNFVAIDIETANADMGSICQIGLAIFNEGKLVEEWSSYVDPEDYFDSMNISIHGIGPDAVIGKPRLPELADELRMYMENNVVVCHTHFDRLSLARAFAKYQLQPISVSWLDSARVVRRTWKELAMSGYGLKKVCKKIGYEFKHHDALEDAKAAGHVLLAAMKESQVDLSAWQKLVKQPIGLASLNGVLREANPEGDLFGEVLVFTGSLDLPRREAAELAANIGCQVTDNVTKKTTILVVGDQDILRLAGHEKSNKHRKAEELAAEGHSIRILRETDFKALVST